MGKGKILGPGTLNVECPANNAKVNPTFNCCGTVETTANKVTADVGSVSRNTTPDPSTGKWQMVMGGLTPSSTPYTLTVRSWQNGTKLDEVTRSITVVSSGGTVCTCPP